MEMDIAWILEFLFRQSLDDRVVKALCRLFPLSNNNSRLKKVMLLRKIESEIANGSISENILALLEHIEELDCIEGIEALESMKAAYCAVAVHCTVRFLDDDEGKYFVAVKRIWRGRVCNMEGTEKVGLVSEELRNWKDEIEAAVWDASASKKLFLRNKMNDALAAVRAYVAEAKERMGPSFLELVAEALSDDSVREVLRLGSNGVCDQVRERVPNAEPDVFLSNSNKEMSKGKQLPRRKHVATKRSRGAVSGTSRGVKIADTEELGVGTSRNRYGCPPTPEVNEVQEALKLSSLELQAVVRDPLPDALHLADAVISSMARENMDHEPAVGNQNKSVSVDVDVDPPDSSADRSVDAAQAIEGNLGNQCSGHQNNAPKPSLMARNSTAHTYEWGDSIDGLPEGSDNRLSRLQSPSLKKRVVSPLKLYETTKLSRRRKIKRWSILEEDTLRTGVQKYGKGNWKLILNSYHDIFEERTEVDLKDKWRNMIRYS